MNLLLLDCTAILSSEKVVMPLTYDQERLEHELRVEQMAVQVDKARFNIEKLRLDMQSNEKKLRFQLIGIAVSASGIVVAAFAAGAAWMHYFKP